MLWYNLVVNQKTAHLDAIGKWARTPPLWRWRLGVPPVTTGYVAVQTLTGRILTGKAPIFTGRCLNRIAAEPKYGPVMLWIEAGD